MANLITQQDFNCIGNVAKHCDLQKLCIAIEEAQNFDLLPLLCSNFYIDVISNLTNPAYLDLWNGGNFVGCNNKTEIHFGLKRILVYYAYSRYILLNGFNDTANGNVQKTNDFSIPTPLKDLTTFSEKYRNMGYDAWHMTLKYLCKNKNLFLKFESNKCSCDCQDCKSCDGQTNNQIRIRTKIIQK